MTPNEREFSVEESDPIAQSAIRSARAFIEFIDDAIKARPESFYTELFARLADIAAASARNPSWWGALDGADESEIDRVEESDQTDYAAVSRALDALTLPECHRFEAESHEFVASDHGLMLFDDLADMYRDLSRALRWWGRGDRIGREQAMWEWQEGFRSHFGAHICRAMMTIHAIRSTLYVD